MVSWLSSIHLLLLTFRSLQIATPCITSSFKAAFNKRDRCLLHLPETLVKSLLSTQKLPCVVWCHYFFKYFFCPLLSFFLWIFITSMLKCLTLSHRSPRLCLLFSIFLFLFWTLFIDFPFLWHLKSVSWAYLMNPITVLFKSKFSISLFFLNFSIEILY